MKTDQIENPAKLSLRRRIAVRVWGVLPIVLLLIVIIGLGRMVAAKSDRLEAVKQGVTILEAKQTAAEQRDKVAAIIGDAADLNAATEQIATEFGFTAEQAKAVVHMPMGTLSRDSREALGAQIAYVKEQIAAGNVEITSGQPDVNVVVMELKPERISDRINLPGAVEPWVKYNIVSEVRAQVAEKRIVKGTLVQAGDVIAVLDTRDYVIARDAAKAGYDNALTTKERLVTLVAKNLTPRSQLDDTAALLERYRAELDSANLNLERCTIRSPITGIINDVFIEKGQYVNVSDPVAEVVRMDKVKVSVGIPESDVSAVAGVNEFNVAIDALGGKVFAAKKHFLSVASDSAARLYMLELVIDNPSGEILPDMFARVDIVKGEIPEALSVPLYSIITLKNEQTVYVVNDDMVHARKIRTGIQEGWRMQVTEGLAPGDRLIVVGQRRVSDGQKVKVIKTVSNMEDI